MTTKKRPQNVSIRSVDVHPAIVISYYRLLPLRGPRSNLLYTAAHISSHVAEIIDEVVKKS
jgi:hypothetical protein